jgi:4-hydroxybenzoate polyprenyltransferase
LWSLIYDSIYAFQDIEDDLKIGVKSSAIKFSDRPQQTLASLTAIMFAMIFVVGLMQGFSRYFYLFMMAAFLYELFLIVKCDYSSPSLCLKAFKANVIVGLLILVAIILG